MKRSFTLIEITIAVALASVVVLTAYAGFNSGLSLVDRIRRDTSGSAQSLLECVSRDLRSAYGDPSSPFVGTRTSFQTRTLEAFPVRPRGLVVAADRKEVHYWLIDERLMYRSIALPPPASDGQDPGTELIHGVKSLRFAYFDGSRWQDSWNSDSLPEAVSVSVAIRASGVRFDTYTTVIDLPCVAYAGTLAQQP